MSIKEVLENARKYVRKRGGTLVVDDDVIIDENHLNVVWYGGTIATILRGRCALEIVANGEVEIVGEHNGSEFRYRNRQGSGAFSMEADDSLRLAFASDAELEKALDNDEIHYEGNSWFEYFAYAEDDVELSNWVEDSDSILDVFSEKNLKELVDQLIEEGEEYDRHQAELEDC